MRSPQSQQPRQCLSVVGRDDRSYEERKAGPLWLPARQNIGGLWGELVQAHEGPQDCPPQGFEEFFGLPVPESIELAIDRKSTIADAEMKVGMEIEGAPPGVLSNDDPRPCLLNIRPPVSMGPDVGHYVAAYGVIDGPSQLAEKTPVLLNALTQPHLLGQGDDQVSMVHPRYPLDELYRTGRSRAPKV